MNRDQQLEAIRAKCIEANADIVSDREWHGQDGRTIHLADVLLAIYHINEDWSVTNIGKFEKWELDEPHKPKCQWRLARYGEGQWDLRLDDLNEQDDETISFLYDLLK